MVALLFAVVGPAGRVAPTALLLTGVVFNAVASAAIVFLATLVGFGEGTRIFVWLIGNLSGARTELAGWVALFLGLGLACAWPLARRLDLLALGEDAAAQLGVEVERTRGWLLLATSLMVGAAVAVSGLIGFV
ncbi:MAG: iron chelate uptake ABC transporter family permease subunit, partial [Myxococcota bacterium]|nr:iron chelate uptake ABC transporter family permease subunit [Myxococcota bacterium]